MALVTGRIRYRGKGSEVETESSVGWLVKFREGRMTMAKAMRDLERVLEMAARQV